MMYNYASPGDDFYLSEGLYHPSDIKVREDSAISAKFACTDAIDDFISEDEFTKSITFESLEGSCKVSLHYSNQIFEVEYCRMLNSRKVSFASSSPYSDPNRIKTNNFIQTNH